MTRTAVPDVRDETGRAGSAGSAGRARRTRAWAATAVLAFVLAGCGGGGDDAATPTTARNGTGRSTPTSAPTATPVTASPPDTPLGTATSCATPGVDSPADFDPRQGQYAAYVYGANPTTRSVAFDVIQLPGGSDDADPGVARDHTSIVNARDHTDQAIVSPDARFRGPKYNDGSDTYDLGPSAFEVLLNGVRTVAYLGFRDGAITDVCFVITDEPYPGYRSATGPTPGSEADCPSGTSRADFDPKSGSYAVYLYQVDVSRPSVAFDVVQFLSGDDAVQAYRREHPDDPNGFPDNDYEVLNAFEHTDEAAVATDADIWLLAAGETGAPVHPVPAELGEIRTYRGAGRHPGYGLYRMALADGKVTSLCQVFTP